MVVLAAISVQPGLRLHSWPTTPLQSALQRSVESFYLAAKPMNTATRATNFQFSVRSFLILISPFEFKQKPGHATRH
jgi:hypothetical protein